MGRDTSIWVEEGPVKAVVVQLHGADCQDPDSDPTKIYLGWKHFHVTTPTGLAQAADRDSIREALAAWYRAQAKEVFQDAVAEWKPIVAPRSKPVVQISNAKAQWGSCSSDGVLRFSWRCMMLPEYEIEYIVVHELAHLKVRNHSKAFWRVVAKAYGDDVNHVRALLRQTARTLPR
jgi:predicted metal-dependent hydrolase